MNYLFTTWEGGGCVTPALDVVRQLMARGHQVRVLSDACNQREAEASGARFIPWQRAPSRPDRTPETQVFRDWAAPTPQAGLMEVVRDIWCAPALAYAQDLLAELRREPADLVVTSECLFGVMAACESSGQRCVIFAPTISLSALPGVPPLGPGLAPARNDEERAQHAAIAAGITGMFDSGLPLLNEARAALNLPPLVHLMDQFRAAEFEFQGTARAFDFATDPLPPRVRYVGPQISDPHWVRKWVSPWPDTDGRPLILVSFSTTFQNHAGVLQRIIQALATTPTRVLVTLGGAIRADELQPAANCVLVESAPHSEVLPAASLVIHHGGHGTVMRTLLGRLPMLVIPHGRDQNDNAVRITERGAGLSLPPDASVDAIRLACDRLMQDPTFRQAAQQLGDRVAAEAKNSTLIPELEAVAAIAHSG